MTVFEILPEYYLWNLQKKVESVTTKKQAHSSREQTHAHQGRDRVRQDRERITERKLRDINHCVQNKCVTRIHCEHWEYGDIL